MSTLVNWSEQDETNFTISIKRYTTKASAELYLQSSLAYYKDQHYTEEQLVNIERCMRDILDRTYFEEETRMTVSGLESGKIKKDPKTYTRTDWDRLDTLCKPYPFLNVKLRGSDVVRVLKLIETRNKPLSDDPILPLSKGKIKWDILFETSCKD